MITLRICGLEPDERFEKVECSVDEIESSADDDESSDGDDDDDDDVEDLILTDSLAVHLTERVLLLAVKRAYERVDGDVSVGSVLELFIYVRSFERSDSFYTFSPLNVIGLVRLVPIERKQSRQ
jgi:hypothetical protein